LLFAELNEQPMKLLRSTGFVSKIGEDCFIDSTEEAIKTANIIITKKINVES